MSVHRFLRVVAIAYSWALALFTFPVFAQGCYGNVVGVSSNYDPSTGSGFLALRAGPRSEASQVGELFNGDVVQIVGKNGKWFRVITSDGTSGWAFRQYIAQRCGL